MTALPRSATALRAAEMYFIDNMTMDEIGHALGCSRATVSRLVNEAKTSGLVEIVVHRKGRAPSTLERVIGDRYGVRVTVVLLNSPRRWTLAPRLLDRAFAQQL